MSENNSRQIASNIQKAANIDLPMALTKAMENACLVVERAAKANATGKGTGNLRSSITHKVVLDTGYVFSTIDYAPYVEAGTGIHATMGSRAKKIPWVYCDAAGNWHTTSGMVAKPFLKPARDYNLSAIKKCFEGII